MPMIYITRNTIVLMIYDTLQKYIIRLIKYQLLYMNKKLIELIIQILFEIEKDRYIDRFEIEKDQKKLKKIKI